MTKSDESLNLKPEAKQAGPAYSDPASENEYRNLKSARDDLYHSSGEHSRRTKATRLSNDAAWMKYSALAFQMIGMMLIPIGGGYFLDDFAGTSPFGIVAGALLGVTAAMWTAVRPFLKPPDETKKS